MGNNTCCIQEEKQQNHLMISSELKLYRSFRWHDRIQELSQKQYNHTPLINEFKDNPSLQTIRKHLYIQSTLLNDFFMAFLKNPKDLMMHSMMKQSWNYNTIIQFDGSITASMAQSFIKVTDMQNHLDLKEQINKFVCFFSEVIIKFYNTKIEQDQIKILIIDELFLNQGFYDQIKSQYDKGLSSKTKSYRQYIQKHPRSLIKYDKAAHLLCQIEEIKQPSKKLQKLAESIKALNCNKADADKMLDMTIELIVQANIPYLVTQIKLIQHFAGEIDSLGEYGYVLTNVMGALMMMIDQ